MVAGEPALQSLSGRSGLDCRLAMRPSPTQNAPSQRRAGPWLAAALLCAACSRPAEPAIRPLTLAALAPVPALSAAESARRIGPLPELEPWTASAARAELGPPPSGEGQGLYLHGREEKRVRIPGPFDPADFNQVAVELFVKSHTRLVVRLLRGGEPVASSGPLRLWSSDEPQRALARFPHNELEREPFDAIELDLPAQIGPVCITAVELVARPIRSWVRAPGSAAELTGIGGDERLASVLSERTAIGTRFEASAGDELVFSCALSESVRFPGQRPQLRVLLEGRGRRRESRHALEPGPGSAPGWIDLRLSLKGFEGREVDARFELEVEGELPAFAYIAEPRLVPASDAPRTVVLISSDTHRADHLGSAESGVPVHTPALDELAARGIVFERAYATSNITVPSHAALMTGLHPRDTHVITNTMGISREARTLAEAFRGAGYRTFAAVSVYHLGDALSGLGQGFDRMSAPVESERPANEVVDLALRWLESARGEPVFLWLHLFDAHAPYEPPPELAARAQADSPAGDEVELTQEVLHHRALYRAEVSFVDRELGRLLRDARVARGILAFTADHGECLGQHGIYFAHEHLYPDTVHVPLLLHWPDAPGGRRVQAPVQNARIARTLLDLAGLRETPFPGRSLLEELGSSPVREPSFAIAFGARSASITHERWHLVLHLSEHTLSGRRDGHVYELHSVELFDLEADPGCLRNLVEVEPERARMLRRLLVEWLASASPSGLARAAEVDAEVRARLGALGYATEDALGAGAWIDPSCACSWCARMR